METGHLRRESSITAAKIKKLLLMHLQSGPVADVPPISGVFSYLFDGKTSELLLRTP